LGRALHVLLAIGGFEMTLRSLLDRTDGSRVSF